MPPADKYWTKQRVISVIAVSVISFVGLESLVYINNLYQLRIYAALSFYIYFLLLVWLYFIFDLHFKPRHYFSSFLASLHNRVRYLLSWKNLRHFQNYLILPGMIYWGSIILIGINFGYLKLQHFVAIASGLALVIAYSTFKEIFNSKAVPIYDSHFVVLTYIKLYAAWLIYSAALGIVWYYCFPAWFFYLVIYLVTFMLLYQALFQFAVASLQNILFIFLISLVLTAVSVFVYRFWNVNYFSAGLIMTAVYNLLWTLMLHSIKKTLTAEVLLEQLAIFALLATMVFGMTNFRAKIGRCL